jgi:hypothetical protein
MLGSVLAVRLGQAKSPSAPPVLTACAAFALNGGSATATTDVTRIALDFTDPSGKTSRLSTDLHDPATKEQANIQSLRRHLYSCRVFFDQKSDLVAIGITSGFPETQRLQVAVADARKLAWIGNFTVEPQPGLAGPVLAGFIEGTTSLVVVGISAREDVAGNRSRSLSTLLFSPAGKPLSQTPTTRIVAGPGTLSSYIDAVHNRLWSFPSCSVASGRPARQPACPIRSTSLTGDQPFSSQFDPAASGEKTSTLWKTPDTFAAPDSHSILIAENVSGVNTIWRVDIQKQTLGRLALPKRLHLPQFEEIHGAATLSPDGGVLAVSLLQYASARPDRVDNYMYKGTDIAVVQLDPMRLLGILPHGRAVDTPAFAVDHRQGKATLLVYQQDHWVSQKFSESPHP